jgi:hypothetical protein
MAFEKVTAMRNPRRVVNVALIVVAIGAVATALLTAMSGGHSSGSGNAQACDSFWSWYDSTGRTAPAITAYKAATTQPLIADLYNVSVGLQDQAKGLNGNKAANAAFAQSAGDKVVDDCTSAGFPDPSS